MNLTLQDVTSTSSFSPSRWEGKTTDGRYAIVRYRDSKLEVRVFDDEPEGVDEYEDFNQRYTFKDTGFDAENQADLSEVRSFLSQHGIET